MSDLNITQGLLWCCRNGPIRYEILHGYHGDPWRHVYASLRCQRASIAISPWKAAFSTLLEPWHERSFDLHAEGSVELPPERVYLQQTFTERRQRLVKMEISSPFLLPLSASTTSTTPTVSTAASTNLGCLPVHHRKRYVSLLAILMIIVKLLDTYDVYKRNSVQESKLLSKRY